MKKSWIIFTVVFLTTLCSFFSVATQKVQAASTETGSTNVILVVPGCNNNGLCEAILGEDFGSCPLDCPNTTGGGITTSPPSTNTFATTTISDLQVVVSTTTNTATITWTTNLNSQMTLSWGLTPDYEIGAISELLYTAQHKVILNNLQPGTLYYFKIEGKSIIGGYVGQTGLTFHTHTPEYTPPNLSNFRATVMDGTYVLLSWRNSSPQNSVRIVRSDIFYPRTPQEGKVVYEGFGNSTPDFDVVKGKTYYYTAFVLSENGKYSSGVMAAAYIPVKRPVVDLDEPIRISDPLPQTSQTPRNLVTLPLKDVSFIQNDTRIIFDRIVPLRPEMQTTIIVPKPWMPDSVRTIVVTITNVKKPDESTMFFLIPNDADTDYTAVMGPLYEKGRYSISIVGLNSENRQVARIDGFIDVSTESKLSLWDQIVALFYANKNLLIWTGIALFALFSTLLIFKKIMRRKKTGT